MGNVVPLATFRHNDFIDEAYDKLAALPGFRVRKEQKSLSRWVKQGFVDDCPVVVEAPTGTGKTLGYLIGALAAAKELRQKGKSHAIVISTDTVGLQSQVVTGDIPKLVEAGLMAAGDAVLAKGRNRYYCSRSADRLLAEAPDTTQFDIFETEENEEIRAVEEVRRIDEAYHSKAWDGDVDNLKSGRPIFWAKVAASADTCTSRKCPDFDKCAYFRSRKLMANASVIVANHSLVLSDLRQQLDEKETVFPFSKYFLVFDEAHHVPTKAIDAGRADIELARLSAAVVDLRIFAKQVWRHPVFSRVLTGKKLRAADFETDDLGRAVGEMSYAVETLSFDAGGNCRFPKGCVPAVVESRARLLKSEIAPLVEVVEKAIDGLKSTKAVEKEPKLKTLLAQALAVGIAAFDVLRKANSGLDTFLVKDEDTVRWVSNREGHFGLNAAPMSGVTVLQRMLWDNERVRVAMVSATLRDFKGFDRFRVAAGLPDATRTHTMSPVFPYGESTLTVPYMAHTPKMAERKEYIAELKAKLPRSINAKEATLVLFPSWGMMREMAPVLKEAFGDKVRCQGDAGIKELVANHRAAVDAGQGAVLCGVATMSEGLDLPGQYCTHVVITALPFAVPTEPVEQERAERMGNKYFSEHSLPEALVKLVQMTGRLLRRETDRGHITVFDRRLAETFYGRKMLEALPPFQKIVEKKPLLSVVS